MGGLSTPASTLLVRTQPSSVRTALLVSSAAQDRAAGCAHRRCNMATAYATEIEGRPLAPKEQLRHPIAAAPVPASAAAGTSEQSSGAETSSGRAELMLASHPKFAQLQLQEAGAAAPSASAATARSQQAATPRGGQTPRSTPRFPIDLVSPRNKLHQHQRVDAALQWQRLELGRLRVQRDDDAFGAVNDMDRFDEAMDSLLQRRPAVGDSSRILLPLRRPVVDPSDTSRSIH